MEERHCPEMRGQLALQYVFAEEYNRPIGVEIRSLEYPDRSSICYFDEEGDIGNEKHANYIG